MGCMAYGEGNGDTLSKDMQEKRGGGERGRERGARGEQRGEVRLAMSCDWQCDWQEARTGEMHDRQDATGEIGDATGLSLARTTARAAVRAAREEAREAACRRGCVDV